MCLMDTPDEEKINALALEAGELRTRERVHQRRPHVPELQRIVAKMPD